MAAIGTLEAGTPAPGEADPAAPAGMPGHASAPWIALGPADAPAILFVHGTRLTASQWWPQLRRLSDRFRCVAIDLPGHGARAGERFTLAAACDAVAAAIDAEVPSGRAILVGLSLGGYVAIEAAERDPGRVAGLVLAGCSAEPSGPLSVGLHLLAWILDHAPARALDGLNALFFRSVYGAAVADPLIAGGFWSAGGAQALRTLPGRHYLDRLARLWTPVLVVNGALDPVFGPGGDSWAAACRRGRHVVLPRAMHLSSLDRPGAFARAVGAFADEVARDA